mgnify:FL=1
MNRIAVLGEGVTGKAVRETLARVDGYELVALDQADLAVASPGIPPKDYPETTIPIISEIEFAYRLMHRPDSSYRPKLVGITGTNGKSTVTALLAHMMDIPALGNFGTPLVTLVDSPTAPEWLVVELSSYQLERCFDFRPDIAVILNLAPDHFSRHDSMLGYATEKAKIFQSQLAEDVLFFNRDITLIRPLADESKGQVVFFSDQDDFSSIDLPAKMVGGHNRVNVWIAT